MYIINTTFRENVYHFSVPYSGHCKTVYADEQKRSGKQIMKHLQI